MTCLIACFVLLCHIVFYSNCLLFFLWPHWFIFFYASKLIIPSHHFHFSLLHSSLPVSPPPVHFYSLSSYFPPITFLSFLHSLLFPPHHSTQLLFFSFSHTPPSYPPLFSNPSSPSFSFLPLSSLLFSSLYWRVVLRVRWTHATNWSPLRFFSTMFWNLWTLPKQPVCCQLWSTRYTYTSFVRLFVFCSSVGSIDWLYILYTADLYIYLFIYSFTLFLINQLINSYHAHLPLNTSITYLHLGEESRISTTNNAYDTRESSDGIREKGKAV